MSYFVKDKMLLVYDNCRECFVDEFQWNAAEVPSEFDPRAFCRILGNRTVAVIGDSTLLRQRAGVLGRRTTFGGYRDKIVYRGADTLDPCCTDCSR